MIIAVLQARTGSSRLPGKITQDICGKPMLWHQIQRAKLAKTLDKIIVATTDTSDDLPVVEIAKDAGVDWSTGSVDDVLDRTYQSVKSLGATAVVRLTGDCPLIDPAVIDQVVEEFTGHEGKFDHVCLTPEWPEGLDVEIMSFAALERAWNEATKQYEREHVSPYITMSGKFRLRHVSCSQDLSYLRLTVDEGADLEVVRSVFGELYPKHGHNFGLAEILDLYNGKPEIFRPNMDIQRNEGFLKSLAEERQVLRFDPKPVIKNSEEVWSRGKALIPAGTQTLSKGPSQFVDGIAPKYLQRGQGSHVWDVDGNEYIDYPMGLGAVILGHNYPSVSEAIKKQLDDGMSFSLMHPLEVELSELLTDIIPWADMVRFGKNGSDATTGAVRGARAYTGREKILHCGYHGWHDWYVGGTTRNAGVPQGAIDLQFAFPYNDLDAVEKLFDENKGEVAGVIMEAYGMELPEPGYFKGLKELVHENGAVLIFDEVATGFRFRLGGIDDDFDVTPDLACYGKAMGNGMPISALVGTRDVMKVFDDVFYSFTFGGECLSLASSIATIKVMQEEPVFDHIWEVGRRLQDGYNRMVWDLNLQSRTRSIGLAPRTALLFQDEFGNNSLLLKSLFQQEVLKRGILFGAAHAVSYSHSVEDIDMTLAAYQEALLVLKEAVDTGDIESLLEGAPVKPVFRQL
jgi:glutamate-1-semialdehyde 2,1-aminomutase/spore coat polysaccharide biosynthesis protein SpsF